MRIRWAATEVGMLIEVENEGEVLPLSKSKTCRIALLIRSISHRCFRMADCARTGYPTNGTAGGAGGQAHRRSSFTRIEMERGVSISSNWMA